MHSEMLLSLLHWGLCDRLQNKNHPFNVCTVSTRGSRTCLTSIKTTHEHWRLVGKKHGTQQGTSNMCTPYIASRYVYTVQHINHDILDLTSHNTFKYWYYRVFKNHELSSWSPVPYNIACYKLSSSS